MYTESAMAESRKSYPLRMPDDMRKALEALAVEEGRSLHNQILACLRRCIETSSVAKNLPSSGSMPAPATPGGKRIKGQKTEADPAARE